MSKWLIERFAKLIDKRPRKIQGNKKIKPSKLQNRNSKICKMLKLFCLHLYCFVFTF